MCWPWKGLKEYRDKVYTILPQDFATS